jgi:gliding motility-associated-like protein
MSCFTTLYPQVVDYAYNSRATTISDRSIQVDLLQDPDGEGTTYALYRSEGGQSFQPVTTLNQSTDPIITYTDTDVDARNIIYDYKWIVYDGCGQELFETNTARNIVLQASSDKNELVNTLRWNRYQDWEEGVIEYEIYRRLGSEDEFTFLATVDPDGELIYQDDIESFLEDEGQFCYKIVALEEDNSFNSQTFSESNISCATQEPLMWIPNTIVINGHNDIFKPVAGFIDFESYEMEIFNKWGEKIFYTNNIDEGWDGTVNGNQVREDMYQYVIVYRDGSGQAYVDQGPLFVLIGNP